MTERVTKTLIGAFVLGGLALLIVGTLLIGSGKLFSKNASFVLYFNNSLRGLVQGAPVYFKGVRVGKVVSIQISSDSNDLTFKTPVIIELESKLIAGGTPGSDDEDFNFMGDEAVVRHLISRGLRARLGMQSFVTGQLTVDLDMMPDAHPIEPKSLPHFRGIQQIPTVPSSLDALFDVVSRIPVEEIAKDIQDAAGALSRQLAGIDLPALTTSVTGLSEDLRAEIAEWSALRAQTISAMEKVSTLADHADTNLAAAIRQFNATMTGISTLSAATTETVDNVTNLVRDDSAFMIEFSQTMRALREASQAISDLATLLELKPNSLIFGRNR